MSYYIILLKNLGNQNLIWQGYLIWFIQHVFFLTTNRYSISVRKEYWYKGQIMVVTIGRKSLRYNNLMSKQRYYLNCFIAQD